MTKRTTQDLLAERRFNVQEARKESDPVAKATLEAHVAVLDVELAEANRVAACSLCDAEGMVQVVDSSDGEWAWDVCDHHNPYADLDGVA